MRAIFKGNCEQCNRETSFFGYDLRNICGKIHLFGFSFFGGSKYYTYREVLVFFGVKRQAQVGQCDECGTIVVKCPYCKVLLNKQEALKEKCSACNKPFYICV